MQLATQRSIEIKTHPLVRKNYVVPTPSIDGFYERIRKCIAYGLSGSMLYGHPGESELSASKLIVTFRRINLGLNKVSLRAVGVIAQNLIQHLLRLLQVTTPECLINLRGRGRRPQPPESAKITTDSTPATQPQLL